jgi:hypothetical protein
MLFFERFCTLFVIGRFVLFLTVSEIHVFLLYFEDGFNDFCHFWTRRFLNVLHYPFIDYFAFPTFLKKNLYSLYISKTWALKKTKFGYVTLWNILHILFLSHFSIKWLFVPLLPRTDRLKFRFSYPA